MSQHSHLRRTLLAFSFMLPLVAASPADAQGQKAQALKSQGDTQVASGDNAAAEVSYKKAIAADPRYRGAFTALSTHYLRQRKYSEAVSLLKQAVKRDKGYGEGWYNLAYALRKSGKMKAAISAYKTFAKLDPASADPYFGLGLAYKSLEKYADAADAFRRYAELEKRPDRVSWSTKANALALEMEQKAKAAEPAPANKEAAATGGVREEADRLYQEGKVAEAAAKYLDALKANPRDSASLDALATCLFRLRRYGQAAKVFNQATKEHPGYIQGWYNLAYAQRKLGRHAKAVRAYQRYIEKDPDNADPYFGIALAYKGMGRKTDAAKSFERYILKERRPGQDKWIHQARVEIARIKGKKATEVAASSAPTLPGLPPPVDDETDTVAASAADEVKPNEKKPVVEEDEAARRQREQDMAMMAATTAYTEKAGNTGKGRRSGKGKSGRGQFPLVVPAEDRPMAPPVPEEPGGNADTASAQLRHQADTLARMGKCRKAQPMFIRATKLDPYNVNAYNGVAYCAFQLGEYGQGISALRVAMRDNRQYPLAWLHKARLERAAKKNISAVGSFRRYLGGNMPIPDAHFELARTLRDLKMNDQAVRAYSAYLLTENRAFAASQVLAAHQEMKALGGSPPATKITMPGVGNRKVTVAEYIKGRKRQAAFKDKDRKAAEARAAKETKIQARKAAKARKAAEAKAAREAKIQARKDARARKAAEARAAKEAEIQAREDAKAARQAERQASRAATGTGTLPTPAAAGSGKEAGSLEVARAVSGDITSEGTLPFPAAQTPTNLYRSASDAAKGLVKMADREFSRRHLVVALGLYEQAAKLNPASVEALYKGGATAMALGQMDLASSFYRKLLRLNSEDAAARFNLELCRRSAREKASSAQQVEVRSSRVEAMLAARQYAAAAKEASSLLTLSPTAPVYLLRGQARLGKGDLAGALNDGGRALSLNPDLPGAIRLLGDAQARSGKNQKALFYYRLYLARTPIKSSTARQRAEVQKIIKSL